MIDTPNLEAPLVTDHFALAQDRVGDLYPQYRGWRLTTLTLDMAYTVDSLSGLTDAILSVTPTYESEMRDAEIAKVMEEGMRLCELPDDMMGAILVSPDNAKRVFVMIPQILLDTPTHAGPRVTVQELNEQLEGEPRFTVIGGTTTTCVLTFKDGYLVTGHSACLSRENFDWAMGKRISYDRARDAAFAVVASRKSAEIALLAAESIRA